MNVRLAASPAVESLIRSTGARVTSARVRVLALLQASQGMWSHGEIEEALEREDQAGIDRVTLYRVLDWLTGAGLVHKNVDSRGTFRFSALRPEHARHLHFRCTACGDVFCLDAAPPPPPVLPEGFRLAAVDLDVSGECARCAGERS